MAIGAFSWSISNSETGERRQGQSHFDFNLITVDLDANPLEAGTSRNPTSIYEEEFTPTLGVVEDFQLFENFSYDGGDYQNLKDIGLDGCQRLCKIDEQCRAFSYIERSRWCWLKSSVPPSSSKPRITSGLKQTDDVIASRRRQQQLTQKFNILQNFSYDGADYKNVKGIDVDTCQQLCNDEKVCAAFSYIERLRWCWLKSSIPSSSLKDGITSGRRER